jgi:mono/diheme cytochrome c family protein
MRRLIVVSALLVCALVGGGAAIGWHPAIDPVVPGARFDPSIVARGAELAAIGDCVVCHTQAGGRPYAGGRPVATPFGAVTATNITPDPDTGIGRWPLSAFSRAMRQGIDREGRHLYPVLPYPHFTRASDADIAALYAFIMTRAPVHQADKGNDLAFPFNQRILLAGWNLLFLRPGPWQADPSHDAVWNRGAYLVEAVGHCGACHSPHNTLGAEAQGEILAGGSVDDWFAPPLQANARPWTQGALATYLRTGFDAAHGAAAGPMTAVTDELSSVPDADIQAIATYIAAQTPNGAPAAPPPSRRAEDSPTAALFAGACGGCHAGDAPMRQAGAPPLSVSAAVNAPTPQSVVAVLLHGIPWRDGKAAPYMPAFADALTDAQIADLAAWVRASYTALPPWPDVRSAVVRARRN